MTETERKSAPPMPLIVEPGAAISDGRHWVDDMPADDYHRNRSAVSQGALKQIETSPAHFFAHWAKPYDPRAGQDSDILRVGTWLHTALLEPKKYGEAIARPNFGDGRLKETKEAKKQFALSLPAGAVIIDVDDKRRVEAMAMEVLSKPEARQLIEAARKEVTVFWDDDATRVMRRARLDLVAGRVIGDLKTTECARADEWSKSLHRNDYDFQAGQYEQAFQAVEKARPDEFMHIVVERNEPYQCAVYRLASPARARGHARVDAAMRTLRACIESGRWPGYPDGIATADLPGYAYRPTEVW
jgi:hypothetical protein